MGIKKSSFRSDINPFVAMEMMEKANILESKGRDIIHMDVGEPGFNTPDHVLDHLKNLIKDSTFGYTEALGMPLLREKISVHYKNWYKQNIGPERIAVTVGASSAFILCLLSAFDVGDKIGIMRPYYPPYLNALKALGLKALIIDGDINTGYQPTVSILKKISQDIKGLIIASPANPTGSVIGKKQILEVSAWCRKKNIRIISDEIYHGIEYEGFSDTFVSCNNDAFVINSFSKYFSMTGWRLGWIVSSEKIIKVIEKLSMAFVLCPPKISQIGAIKVFENYNYLNKNVSVYKKNRDILINMFEKIGLKNFSPPNGAFYVYVDISKIAKDSAELSIQLLNEAGVSCTPGIDFDDLNGKNFIRFSYGGSTETVIEGSKRIENWIKNKY